MRARFPIREFSFSLSALIAALAIFAVALVAFLILGGPAPDSVAVLASTRDARQEGALTSYLERHGGENCSATKQKATKKSRYIVATRAIATVSCDAIGTGAQTVSGWRFRNADDLKDWEYDWRGYLGSTGDYGTCARFGGESPWVRSDGTPAGQIFCVRDGGTVAWSDRTQRAGFVVRSDTDEVSAVLAWWHKHVRGRPSGQVAGMRAIRRAFAGEIRGGLRRCRPAKLPLPDAVMECNSPVTTEHPQTRVDSLTVFHFPNDAALDAFFKNWKEQFRAPSEDRTLFCDKAVLVSATYYNHGDPAGRVFCFPDGNSQYLMWTIDDDRLAAVIDRHDQNERALYSVWQNLRPG